MATEVFYNQNTMNLRNDVKPLPPRKTWSFVRKIRLALLVMPDTIDAFQDLAKDLGVFSNLHTVVLTFDNNDLDIERDIAPKLHALATIRIATQELYVYVTHANFPMDDMLRDVEVDAALVSKFTVVRKSGKEPKAEWSRYVFDRCDRHMKPRLMFQE